MRVGDGWGAVVGGRATIDKPDQARIMGLWVVRTKKLEPGKSSPLRHLDLALALAHGLFHLDDNRIEELAVFPGASGI